MVRATYLLRSSPETLMAATLLVPAGGHCCRVPGGVEGQSRTRQSTGTNGRGHPTPASIAPMASKGMTDAWNGAWAAKPSTWRIMGVMCGPREVDPCREMVRDALTALTVSLKALGG